MKSIAIIVVFFSIVASTFAQTSTTLKFFNGYAFRQLYQLDSIGNSQSTGKYFGNLYYHFLLSIEKQLLPLDTSAQALVRKFEKLFAQFYIDACVANGEHRAILINEWRAYFADTTLQPIQYKLLGANAHLNGGLWQALTGAFSYEEMNRLQKEFAIFKRSLNLIYRVVYREAFSQNKKLKNLAMMSLGMSRLAGNLYLYKWRKRQMRLAKLYWTHSPQYDALLKKIDRKKRNIDRMITTTL